MTRFVESFTTQQMLPPWKSQGARYWGFVVEVPPWCIQQYLDTHFNVDGLGGPPVWYTTRDGIHFGLLVVAQHPDFSGGGNGGADWGKVSHHEVYWSFPAARYERGANNLLVGEPTPVWTQPFGFVNNSYVLFSSREVWGGEKQMAKILLEEGRRPDDLHLDVALQGFKKFSPRTRACKVGVLHARLAPGTTALDSAATHADPQIAHFSDVLWGAIPHVQADGTGAPDAGVPIIIDTLKQFRDVFDVEAATYRAIVSSRSTQSNVQDLSVYSGENVTLTVMWSDSMAEAFTRLFGLSRPSTAAMSPHTADTDRHELDFEVDWDMPSSTVPVRYAVSFTADVEFEAVGTLFTYRQR